MNGESGFSSAARNLHRAPARTHRPPALPLALSQIARSTRCHSRLLRATLTVRGLWWKLQTRPAAQVADLLAAEPRTTTLRGASSHRCPAR